jgi:hypothetical protein
MSTKMRSKMNNFYNQACISHFKVFFPFLPETAPIASNLFFGFVMCNANSINVLGYAGRFFELDEPTRLLLIIENRK